MARPLGLLLAALLVAPAPAFAQMGDLLTPLTPGQDAKKKQKPKGTKRRAKPAKPAAPEARPAPATPDIPLTPLVAEKARLQVTVSPADKPAKLFVDGKPRGEVPGPVLELEPGVHQVEVRRLGFAEARRQVELSPGEPKHLVLELQPTAAVLEVVANVEGAEVFLDEKRVGLAPVRELLLPPGTYALAVRKAGFREERSELRVRAGRDYTAQAALEPSESAAVAVADSPTRSELTPGESPGAQVEPWSVNPPRAQAALEPAPPLHKRWYFWAGVGAAAVAVGAGAYALGRDPGGPPSESAVCGGAGCAGSINAPAR